MLTKIIAAWGRLSHELLFFHPLTKMKLKWILNEEQNTIAEQYMPFLSDLFWCGWQEFALLSWNKT